MSSRAFPPSSLSVPRSADRGFFLAAVLILVAAAFAPLRAQLSVDLTLERSMFILHEPVVATVSVTNNSGEDIMLADTEVAGPWFSFGIKSDTGRRVPPRDAHYELQPLSLKAGDTVKRTVNLHDLYALDDFGDYMAQASIFFPPIGRYFTTKACRLIVTEGTIVWKQTIGVPDAADADNSYRSFTLLTMEHEKGKDLYVRVQGKDDVNTYGCYDLGPIIANFPPDAKFDSSNNLWVLQLVGEKTFFLSRIGARGDFQGQSTYITPKSIPYLRRQPNGALQIVGAYPKPRMTPAIAAEQAPKLSDRPANLPTR
jgi:hypothetical protein